MQKFDVIVVQGFVVIVGVAAFVEFVDVVEFVVEFVVFVVG